MSALPDRSRHAPPFPPAPARGGNPGNRTYHHRTSLDAIAVALARHGTPAADDDPMILRGGIRAVLVSGPDGHRFLVAEQPREPTRFTR